VTRLDSTNRYGTIAQLRSISGSLQGAAALFTELARASAAAGVALESSSAALAANAAAVINNAGGLRRVGAGAHASVTHRHAAWSSCGSCLSRAALLSSGAHWQQ
jgi:hypothetical protein